jgi:capsular polysaccharide biosynthesis protein
MFRLFLFRLLESYYRHRWLYLIPIIVLLISGIAFVALTKPRYRAHGILYIQKDSYLSQLTAVRANDGSWWATPSQITSNEMSSLLETDAFIRAIIRSTSLESKMAAGPDEVAKTIEEVRKSVWVHPMGDNQVFIGATYEDPLVSVNMVDAIIENFLYWKSNGERTDSEVALSFFGDLIDKYRAELDKSRVYLNDFLDAHPEPVRGSRPLLEQMEIKRIEREIDLIESRYSAAMGKEEDARLSIAQVESDTRQTYLVIDAPHLPFKNANSRREMLLKISIFFGVGLLLSAGGVVGSALLNHTFLVPVDVQQKLNLPVLAAIPANFTPVRKKTREKLSKPKKAQDEQLPADQAMSLTSEGMAAESSESQLQSSAAAEENAAEKQPRHQRSGKNGKPKKAIGASS